MFKVNLQTGREKKGYVRLLRDTGSLMQQGQGYADIRFRSQ
jgi:hypothetical protein